MRKEFPKLISGNLIKTALTRFPRFSLFQQWQSKGEWHLTTRFSKLLSCPVAALNFTFKLNYIMYAKAQLHFWIKFIKIFIIIFTISSFVNVKWTIFCKKWMIFFWKWVQIFKAFNYTKFPSKTGHFASIKPFFIHICGLKVVFEKCFENEWMTLWENYN